MPVRSATLRCEHCDWLLSTHADPPIGVSLEESPEALRAAARPIAHGKCQIKGLTRAEADGFAEALAEWPSRELADRMTTGPVVLDTGVFGADLPPSSKPIADLDADIVRGSQHPDLVRDGRSASLRGVACRLGAKRRNEGCQSDCSGPAVDDRAPPNVQAWRSRCDWKLKRSRPDR